jgi:opacity protein-like surface antigen
MKRAIFLVMLGVCGAGLAPVEGWAQTSRQPAEVKYLRVPHRFQIFIDGGIGQPTEPGIFNDYWNTAFNFGLGFGVSIKPWLEVNATYNHAGFGLNAIESKGKIKYTGIQEVQGGSVSTTVFSGSVRFLAVPKARTNPYVEIGVGAFSSKGEDVVIEDDNSDADDQPQVHNTMEDVNGISVWPAVGIQYAMSDRWSAYSRYTYMMNLNDKFAPGDLLLPPGGGTPTIGGNQVISSIIVGLMVRF